jgi:CRISPR/Cas system endoribonuclease Cas6 (RAMP superfamily)
MPQRLRFALQGRHPAHPFQHATGLRALVMGWLRAADPGLSEQVHDANQPKPLNISPIWYEADTPGAMCFEVSVLVDWMVAPLLEGARLGAAEIRLGPQAFRMGQPEVVAAARWEELLGRDAGGLAAFEFRVLSPTAHHVSGLEPGIRKSVVLPSPELYFGSWLNRWNLCCEQKFTADVLTLVEQQVAVTHCAGSTQRVLLDGARPFLGFEGSVRFALLKPERVDLEGRMALAALARFADFCGTGVETMRGMGQTQFVGRGGVGE